MTFIEDFWRSHPKYWIAIGPIQAIADVEIYKQFCNYNIVESHWIDQVIYLDQFMRHFSRIIPDKITDFDVYTTRNIAVNIVKSHIYELSTLDEFQLMVCLMPFKHVRDYDFIFTTIHKHWIPFHDCLTSYSILLKFYNDSYNKYYSNIDTIYKNIVIIDKYSKYEPYNSELICDYYPSEYLSDEFPIIAKSIPDALDALEALKKHFILDAKRPFIVSLSGGVDSMVMCYLLHQTGIPFIAVHIVYGNRAVSKQECSFIKHYCQRLDIPLYIYYIEWLRREDSDREFYERMTRTIRFLVYRSVGGEKPHVLLGHIQEDIVENIWSNFARCIHLDNLAKMESVEFMEGVYIHRPWLHIQKSTIYSISKQAAIPFLKNTTPSWSNRGKFRETFYNATRTQYGETVDDKIIESASALASQFELVNQLLYKPIYDSWDEETKTIDVRRAIEVKLDAEGWSKIFTTICHTRLGITKPSIHACRNFVKCISHGSQHLILKKDLKITYSKFKITFAVCFHN